jgi:hypothetical protein
VSLSRPSRTPSKHDETGVGSGVRDVDGEGEATAAREALALGVVAGAEKVAELADTLCEGDGLEVAAATVEDGDVVGVPDGVAPWLL